MSSVGGLVVETTEREAATLRRVARELESTGLDEVAPEFAVPVSPDTVRFAGTRLPDRIAYGNSRVFTSGYGHHEFSLRSVNLSFHLVHGQLLINQPKPIGRFSVGWALAGRVPRRNVTLVDHWGRAGAYDTEGVLAILGQLNDVVDHSTCELEQWIHFRCVAWGGL